MTTASGTGPSIEPSRTLARVLRIHLRVPAQQRQSIYESLQTGTRADLEYAALVGLAALIALLGLLQNSAAVIIGAMLISPMMNPLLAGALALLLGDGKLGRRASIVLGGSVVASVALTWLIDLLIPLNQATPQILARTTPNLLDLFIAFLSGLAGTLALRGGPSSLMILPGVAIAVAVVPPLAVVGFGLSTRQFSIAAGAFLLFLTNLVAIVISAALVFRSMGFRPQRAAEAGRWKLKYRMAISSGVLLILSIPLFLTLHRAVSQIRTRSEINRNLDTQFRADNASISDLSLSFARHGLQIHVTVRTTKYLDPAQITAVEKSLQNRFGQNARLQVDQILVAVGGVSPPRPAQNVISGGVVRPVPQPPPFDFKTSVTALVQRLQTQLDRLLAGSSIQRAAPLQVQLSGGTSVIVIADFSAPKPFAPPTMELLAAQLSSRMSFPIELNGTVQLTGASYVVSFDAPPSARALRPANRRAIEGLIHEVLSTPALRLQISYAIPPSAPAHPIPRLVASIQTMLASAGLKPSQWSISEATPVPAAAAAPAQAAESGPAEKTPPSGSALPLPVHYDCRIVQLF